MDTPCCKNSSYQLLNDSFWIDFLYSLQSGRLSKSTKLYSRNSRGNKVGLFLCVFTDMRIYQRFVINEETKISDLYSDLKARGKNLIFNGLHTFRMIVSLPKARIKLIDRPWQISSRIDVSQSLLAQQMDLVRTLKNLNMSLTKTPYYETVKSLNIFQMKLI